MLLFFSRGNIIYHHFLSGVSAVKKRSFLFNALFMTLTSFLLKTSDIFFGAFTAGKIGAEGIGLYSLTCSVFSFAITLSLSGLNLAVTRIVSEAAAGKKSSQMKRSVLLCALLGLIMSSSAATALFLFAEKLSLVFIKNPAAAPALKFLALSLPFMALSSCMKGYLVASEKVSFSVVSNIVEQVTSIITITLLLSSAIPKSLEFSCFSLAAGAVSSEIFVFIYLLCVCSLSKKRSISKTSISLSGISSDIKSILSICVPTALSSYLRSAIVTAENLLIPRGLTIFSGNSTLALEQYGTIKGMALPVISFPSAVIVSFGILLVPEISRSFAKNNLTRVSSVASRSLKYTLSYSCFVMCVFLFFGRSLGTALYSDAATGFFISTLATAVPLMYLDFVTDSLLKGLGQQVNSLKYNTIDSIYRTALVFFLIPKFGMPAYIFIIISGSLLNVFLSMRKLVSLTDMHLSLASDIISPLVFSLLICTAIKLLSRFFLSLLPNLFSAVVPIALCCLIYAFSVKKLLKI